MPRKEKYWRYRDSSLAGNKRRYALVSAFLAEQKSAPCMDCGNTFPPECMDFDHRDPSSKLRSVGSMTQSSRTTMLSEMEKCDLVCANCHRTRTVNRRRD